MIRKALSKLRLRSEEGAALIVTLGVTAAMGFAVASSLAYSTQNYNSALMSRAGQNAYSLAEAGLNNALSTLANPANNPLDWNLLPGASQQYERGTATWSGTLDRVTAVWTVTATGEERSAGNGQGTMRHRLSARVRLRPAAPRPLSSPAWNYIFSQRTGTTCDLTVASRVVVDTPLYSMGNICLNSGTRVVRGPLVARRRLTLSSVDSAVGSALAPIGEAHVGIGCRYYTHLPHPDPSHPTHPFCSVVDNVYATVLDQSPPAISPPVAQWDAWYATASPGPRQPCAVASGTPPVLENEAGAATRNNSVVGQFNLTPLASYSCRVGPADAPIGELSWDASARTLRIAGAVFIDGSAAASNGAVNAYVGRGTLYLSGTFQLGSGTKLCARVTAAGCDFSPGAWNPSASLLTIATSGHGGYVTVGTGFQLTSGTEFQGAALAAYAIQLASGTKTQGPLIGSTILFGADGLTYPIPDLADAPAGMPGDPAVYPTLERPDSYSG